MDFGRSVIYFCLDDLVFAYKLLFIEMTKKGREYGICCGNK